MPFKHNTSRRHQIETMKFRVSNRREYEAGLRRRGSLTLWVTPEALSKWQAPRRKTRGGQHRYSDLAVEIALTLGLVFGLQTEAAIGCAVLNRMLACARPKSVRRKEATA
jgi:Transposase DDE domain